MNKEREKMEQGLRYDKLLADRDVQIKSKPELHNII